MQTPPPEVPQALGFDQFIQNLRAEIHRCPLTSRHSEELKPHLLLVLFEVVPRIGSKEMFKGTDRTNVSASATSKNVTAICEGEQVERQKINRCILEVAGLWFRFDVEVIRMTDRKGTGVFTWITVQQDAWKTTDRVMKPIFFSGSSNQAYEPSKQFGEKSSAQSISIGWNMNI